ncbi:MAG TPA: VCBS repeat-containing protein [Candidatus Hydrogenedentes bacterium]|nr:VCBS repeat-containing protein [Candidatus Hydrogenedentota bacterium]
MLVLAGIGLVVLAAPANYILEAPENVCDVTATDLNLDGVGDILVLYCDEKSAPPRKGLGIYFGREDGSYPAAPATVIELSPEVGALMLAERDGAPPVELVALDAKGATLYRYAAGAFAAADRIPFYSLLPSGGKEPRFLRNVAVDLDGDGMDEWLIPVPLGVEVRRGDSALAEIQCDVASSVSSATHLSVSHRYPTFHVFDVPDSLQKGLAFLTDEYADFAYGEHWAERDRFRIPVDLEEKWDASVRMADINQDGWPDIMVTQTRGTVNLEVLTQVYLATGLCEYPEQPTATFHAKGAFASGVLADVDGDDYLDMIFVRVPFGPRNIMNFVLRGKVRVEADVYLFRDGAFPSAPSLQDGLTIDAPEGKEQVGHTLADFDGDGRLDLSLATRRDELAVYVGSPDHFISRRPWHTVQIPSFGVARAHDLNRNAAEDLIIFHPSGEHRKRVEVVVF